MKKMMMALFVVLCGLVILFMTLLWHAPRKYIMKEEAKSLFDTYKGNQPSRKYLSRFGLMVENIFYLSGGALALFVLFMAFFSG